MSAADDGPFVPEGAPEFNEAFAALRAGDPGPFAICHYLAGNPAPLAELVLEGMVPKESDLAYFIASVLRGDFKKPADAATLFDRHMTISMVNIYRREMQAWADDPAMMEAAGMQPRLKSMADIYRRVAADLRKEPGAIKQTMQHAARAARKTSAGTSGGVICPKT